VTRYQFYATLLSIYRVYTAGGQVIQTETSFEPTQQKIKATLANYITFNWQWAL